MGFSAGGSSSISTGSDVALNAPTTNNVLMYDSSVSKWKNTNVDTNKVTGLATALAAKADAGTVATLQAQVAAIPSITVSTVAPSSPSVNDIWIDVT